MKILDKIKKNWDFNKTAEQNVITFSNEQEQVRRKGERLRKRFFPLFVILGIAISIFTQNPLIALALFISSTACNKISLKSFNSDLISVLKEKLSCTLFFE